MKGQCDAGEVKGRVARKNGKFLLTIKILVESGIIVITINFINGSI